MPRDGYDFPTYGIDNGLFYALHIPSLVCTVISFVSVIISLVILSRSRAFRQFFTSWTKSERFIVYMAICDGVYNLFHFATHMQNVVVRGPVYPRSICIFYGFSMLVCITAQNLLANVVAINAFMLMFLDKHLSLGRFDWRLLVWVYGLPSTGATVAAILDQLGPTGADCFFDGVKGQMTQMIFTTVPMIIILIINIALYIATWVKIRSRTLELRTSLGAQSASQRGTIKAAKSMSLFVGAFFTQWSVVSIYAAWFLTAQSVPNFLEHLYHILPDIG
ncbi:hypothetical protein MAR_004559, partial [Mya arenaria]